jgi:hypothetical protein
MGRFWQQLPQFISVYAEYNNGIDGSTIIVDVHCHCALVNRTLVIDKRTLSFAKIEADVADE